MIRRKGDALRHSRSAGVDELVTQLEAGSAVARDRLAVQVRIAAAPVLKSGSDAEGGADLCCDADSIGDIEQSEVLDRIAASAAAGSIHSLDLLLGLIVELRLISPAVHRLISSQAMIEDVEQDVLFTVSRSIHSFRGDAKFTTWLYSLARNVTVGHLRRLKPSSELVVDDLLNDGRPRRMSSQVTQRHVVRQAIESLPPMFRQTVLLRDIEGLSYQEIAEREGLELNTVRSRLSRGRAMLASRLS